MRQSSRPGLETATCTHMKTNCHDIIAFANSAARFYLYSVRAARMRQCVVVYAINEKDGECLLVKWRLGRRSTFPTIVYLGKGLVVADGIPLEKARLICAVEGVDDRCVLVDADVASKATGKAVIGFPFSMGRHMAFARQLDKMTRLECVREVVAFPFLLAAAWGVRTGGTFLRRGSEMRKEDQDMVCRITTAGEIYDGIVDSFLRLGVFPRAFLDPEVRLAQDLGFDEIDLAELAVCLGERLGIDPFAIAGEMTGETSVSELADLLERLR